MVYVMVKTGKCSQRYGELFVEDKELYTDGAMVYLMVKMRNCNPGFGVLDSEDGEQLPGYGISVGQDGRLYHRRLLSDCEGG